MLALAAAIRATPTEEVGCRRIMESAEAVATHAPTAALSGGGETVDALDRMRSAAVLGAICGACRQCRRGDPEFEARRALTTPPPALGN